MTRKALNPYFKIALLTISIALIAPTTILFIVGSILLFVFILEIPEAIYTVFFMVPPGCGLFYSWKIALKMDEYCKFGAPFGVYFWTAMGCISFIIILIASDSLKLAELLDNSFAAITLGFGPLISSVTSLLIIRFMRIENN